MKPTDNTLRWNIVPFFHGRVLEMSEGRHRCFPHFINYSELRIEEPDQLGMFADRWLDGIFSSYLLHLIAYESVPAVIREWERVVRDGGHIILHLPKEEVDKGWAATYNNLCGLFLKVRGWDVVHFEERSDGLLFVARLQSKGIAHSWKQPKPKKTCGVVRLGAFGDCIQASSILPWLKEQGYHVTFYVSDHGMPVIKHDPHIDRFIIQGRNEVPPGVLGEFYDHEQKKYDKWVNLCESVEGTLLPNANCSAFAWPNEVRAKYCDRNYLEFTHEIAGVPPPYRPKFYATPEEKAWAKEKARSYGRNILWSLAGSSVHKTWPWMDAVIARVMMKWKDVHVVLVGDEACKILEAGWQQEKRVHCQSGRWSIRESMAFCEVADLIIGTETGLLNAAGLMDTPKIVTLSHSSPEMLTKYWVNATVLTQKEGCPKFPCRQLHEDGRFCMEHKETGTAVCQAAIGPDEMWDAVTQIIGQERMVA